jgi:outer membrane protein TolC
LQVLLAQELEKTAKENLESIAQQVEKSKQLGRCRKPGI